MQKEKPLLQNLTAISFHLILWICLFGCFSYNAEAQSNLALDKVGSENVVFNHADEPYKNDSTITLDIKLKAIQGGQPFKLGKGELEVFEIVNGRKENLDIVKLLNQTEISEDTVTSETFTVLIMADVSSQLGSGEIEKGKKIVEDIVGKIALPRGSKYLFSTFGSDISAPTEINNDNLSNVLNNYKPDSKDSDLYRALFQQVRMLRSYEGKKVLILLTDGKNSKPSTPYYDTHLPYEMEEVIKLFEHVSLDLTVFPIGVGQNINEKFLQKLAETTSLTTDSYTKGKLPPDLKKNLFSGAQLKSNNIVQVSPSPDRNVFMGEKRLIRVIWVDTDSTDISFSLGTTTSPVEIKAQTTNLEDWILNFVIGLVIIIGLLAVFSLMVPFINRQTFKRKYVRAHKRMPGITKRDPLTNEPLEEGELVVVKCKQVTSLSTWDGLGGQCPNYPDCLDFVDPCDGAGAPTGDENFFSMKGVLGRLNWVWFGALGGFIAWTMYAISKITLFGWYEGIMRRLANLDIFAGSIDRPMSSMAIDTLSNETLLGIAFGTGILFALSWVEERGQPRRLSWSRILLRTFLGLIVSFIVFVIGFYIQYTEVLPTNYLNTLATWLILGLAIGLVMAVRSSVSVGRGIMGGVLAAAVGYSVYFFLSTSTTEFALSKLISFIIVGAILGFILVTIITTLEDFEMEYLTPEKFKGTNPISKWLKSGVDVTIGREPGCYVYVKWEDDAVLPHHAILTYSKGAVFIEPLGETMVNGRIMPVKKKTPLKDGDMIQLGRESISKMRYKEKRK